MTGAIRATEELEDLRRQIARLERGVRSSSGVSGLSPSADRDGVPLGYAGIDARFQGGGAPFGVHEVSALAGAEASPALGFSLMMMARTLARAPAGMGLIIQPSAAAAENGALYGPGLAALGLPPGRLALVRVRSADQVLRVADEALRCGAVAAIVAEIWDERPVDLSLTRRFNMSAQEHDVMTFLVTRQPSGTSAAMTRWIVGAAASEGEITRARQRGLRRPRLGRPALQLALTRNRRGSASGWPLGEWQVEWDGEQCCFKAPDRRADAGRPEWRGGGVAGSPGAAVPAPVAGPAGDRPDKAVA